MSDHPHRRDFVRSLALGATVGVLPRTLPADEPDNDAPPTPSEADARMALVLARFGPKLDDDARRAVRAEVESIVRRAEALRKLPLDNGDGPFPVFHPYRAPLA